MQADLAAAYCGEKHVEDFLERVGKVYPLPRQTDSVRRRFWYREDLDRAMGIVDPLVTDPPGKSMGERFAEALRASREQGRTRRRPAHKAP
jgi:hypothetical protein